MSNATDKIEVMQAWLEGKPIQTNYRRKGTWTNWAIKEEPSWNWQLHDYRIKKEKVVERGFDKLIGETIVWIDTSAINVAHFHTQSGKVVSVDAEQSHFGIPVVNAEHNYSE